MVQWWFVFTYVSYLFESWLSSTWKESALKKKQPVDEDLESKSQRRWWWPQWTPPWLTFTRPGRHCQPAPSRATNHRTRILHTNFAPKLRDSGRSQQLGSQLPRRLQPGNKLFLHWQAPNQDTSCLNFEIYHYPWHWHCTIMNEVHLTTNCVSVTVIQPMIIDQDTQPFNLQSAESIRRRRHSGISWWAFVGHHIHIHLLAYVREIK